MALTGQQPLIVGVSVALMILATASDALRFFSRWMMRSGIWWDDWCSLLALFLSYAFNISQFVSVGCNMGKHGANVPNEAASITCTAKVRISPTFWIAR
ncbi:hypothetical protein N7507_000165 [Penicillium longicatenatum]|nr:hypothetical protein N7507_000165 [Penicillium longicatenatum]